ncbi:MAG TPA: cytochrome P450 [Solirubrobacteraceae bacterium]|nr:cytochrome P450 [Solirubrobacteraceae bacterium]
MSDTPLPPGPRLPKTVQSVAFWTRPLAFLERCRARYGSRFTLRLLTAPPFVILTDPDEIKQVFTAPADVLHPGEGARVLEPVVGQNSVILLDEGAHMEQRKLMLPAFHGERVARMSDLVASVAEREVAGWPEDTATELHPLLQRLTLEVVLRAVFGLDPGPRLDALRERLSAMLAFGDRFVSVIPPPAGGRAEKVLERVGPFASYVRLQREADELLFELIDERRDEVEQRDDVLAMLLEARHGDGSPMSDQELRDELMTLLVAGHETTASALAWAFERISRHPAVLGALETELHDGADDAYLTATIYETLRRRPVLPNVAPRIAQRPIEIGGRCYPAGVGLVPCAYLVHHDPGIYPDPYAFRPERFLDQPPGTYTWIPFGGGRRRCLGSSFAMLEMKQVLRAVLRARKLRVVSDGFERPQRRNITIKPGRGGMAWLPRRPAGSSSAH